MLDIVIISIWPIHWIYFQQHRYNFFFKSAAFINLAWVIHPPYACHWPNVTLISSQTDWPDRVMSCEKKETASSPAQQSLRERQSNLLDTAAPSSPFFTAWSMASKMGKKKCFCSCSPPFPGSHFYYDICLEMQGRRDTLPFLPVTGTTGIHNLLYKPEGSQQYQCFVLHFGGDYVSPKRLPDKRLSLLVCLA